MLTKDPERWEQVMEKRRIWTPVLRWVKLLENPWTSEASHFRDLEEYPTQGEDGFHDKDSGMPQKPTGNQLAGNAEGQPESRP